MFHRLLVHRTSYAFATEVMFRLSYNKNRRIHRPPSPKGQTGKLPLFRLLQPDSNKSTSLVYTLQLWLAWNQQSAFDNAESNEEALFVLIAQRRTGNRPGRIEPRAVKRRPKPFSLLTKPREEARAQIRKNGHPKKIK